MTRLLVCGGRDYQNSQRLEKLLSVFHSANPISCLIHGGASGADTLAGEWAEKNGIPVKVFKADWKRYGKSAGTLRNQQMIDEGNIDLAIAFPGGNGTADMIRRLHKNGIEVVSL